MLNCILFFYEVFQVDQNFLIEIVFDKIVKIINEQPLLRQLLSVERLDAKLETDEKQLINFVK